MFSLKPFSTLTLSPNFSNNTSFQENNIGTRSSILSFNTNYTPKSKYNLSISNSFSKQKSESKSSSTTGTISNITNSFSQNYTVSFTPFKKIKLLFNFDEQENKAKDTKTSFIRYRSELTYIISKKMKLLTKFFQQTQKPTINKRREYNLTFRYSPQPGKTLSIESRFLHYALPKQEPYNASIITGRLEIGF
jgi:hypothetical protein